MILDKIVDNKKSQLIKEKELMNLTKIIGMLDIVSLHKTNSFYDKLNKKDEIAIIAEMKKASPSKGIIRERFDPIRIAKDYYDANVEAISVLTEKNFFLGSDEYLHSVRNSFPLTILRKDFIVDEYQIYQSRLIGADAILLIAAILNDDQLKGYYSLAKKIGLDCLVEVHNMEELKRVLDIGANIIGINNRNLKSFDVSLETTEKLIEFIPKNKVVVSESGIKNKNDIRYLKSLGVNAVLIGEIFMKTDDIREVIQEIKTECKN